LLLFYHTNYRGAKIADSVLLSVVVMDSEGRFIKEFTSEPLEFYFMTQVSLLLTDDLSVWHCIVLASVSREIMMSPV